MELVEKRQNDVKSILRSLLLSSPKGMNVRQLCKDYKESIGENIPYNYFGFPSMIAYLQSIPDTLQVRDFGVETLVIPVIGEKTSHIEKMIQSQKKTNKNTRRFFSIPRPASLVNYNESNRHKTEFNRPYRNQYSPENNFISKNQQIKATPHLHINHNKSVNNYSPEDRKIKSHESNLCKVESNMLLRNQSDLVDKYSLEDTEQTSNQHRGQVKKPFRKQYSSSNNNLSENTKLRSDSNLHNEHVLINDGPDFIEKDIIKSNEMLELDISKINKYIRYGTTSENQDCIANQKLEVKQDFDQCQSQPSTDSMFDIDHDYDEATINYDSSLCKKFSFSETSPNEFQELKRKKSIETALPFNFSMDTQSKTIYQHDVVNPEDIIPNIDITQFTIGQYLKIKVAEVYDPSRFWIHLQEPNDDLNKLMDDIQCFYATRQSKYIMPDSYVQVGMYIVGLVLGEWHRGVIVKKYESDVKAFYFDYGSVEYTPMRNIRFLHKSFLYLPQQAIRARLYNIKPVLGLEYWQLGASKRFLNLIQDKLLIATIEEIHEEKRLLDIIITDTSTEVDVHINDVLIKEHYARLCTTKNPDNSAFMNDPLKNHQYIENGNIPSINELTMLINQGRTNELIFNYCQINLETDNCFKFDIDQFYFATDISDEEIEDISQPVLPRTPPGFNKIKKHEDSSEKQKITTASISVQTDIVEEESPKKIRPPPGFPTKPEFVNTRNQYLPHGPLNTTPVIPFVPYPPGMVPYMQCPTPLINPYELHLQQQFAYLPAIRPIVSPQIPLFYPNITYPPQQLFNAQYSMNQNRLSQTINLKKEYQIKSFNDTENSTLNNTEVSSIRNNNQENVTNMDDSKKISDEIDRRKLEKSIKNLELQSNLKKSNHEEMKIDFSNNNIIEKQLCGKSMHILKINKKICLLLKEVLNFTNFFDVNIVYNIFEIQNIQWPCSELSISNEDIKKEFEQYICIEKENEKIYIIELKDVSYFLGCVGVKNIELEVELKRTIQSIIM